MRVDRRGVASARDITLLCLDVDGVLTDGGIILDGHGVESKRFHVRDGTGLRVWMKLGYEVALITGRRGSALQHRARELDIRHLVQGSLDKAADLDGIRKTLGITAEATAVIADDLPDLPMMRRAGYPIAVADAVDEVQAAAAFITRLPGGHGAVREAIEHLLTARRRWHEAVSLF